MFRNKLRAAAAFLVVAFVLCGGLMWATLSALRVERKQRLSDAEAAVSEELFKARQEQSERIRAALWRLDSRLSPVLAREDSRPYPHYVPLHTPFPALTAGGVACAPGQVYLPSPLLTAELPEWMLLHFQIDCDHGWLSPQVIPNDMQKMLRKQPLELALNNVDDKRKDLLAKLKKDYPASSLTTTFRELGISPAEEDREAQRWTELLQENSPFRSRSQGRGTENPFNQSFPPIGKNDDRSRFNNNDQANVQSAQNPVQSFGANGSQSVGGNTISPQQLDYAYRVVITNSARREGRWAYIFDDNRNNYSVAEAFPNKTGVTFQTVDVQLSGLRPVWLPSAEKPEQLLMVRGAIVGTKPTYQGFVIDWKMLADLLKDDVIDLFPDCSFKPIVGPEPAHPERSMTAVPIEFEPGETLVGDRTEPVDPQSLPPAGWTPLRIGLLTAWIAAVIALAAVGIGGMSLLELSERRIRFVSAVTHELRTPLTTLRLYLDLLAGGLVTDEKQKAEYLTTLNGEADRLNRLITNVLDFARLEKSRPAVDRRPVEVRGLLEQVERNWRERCSAAGKELVIEHSADPEDRIETDPNLVEQILANLIDNAQKYSREATDPRIFVRIVPSADGRSAAFEVEDRGPGVSKQDRGGIFRAFRRGADADVKAGGVGLGLALATRWAQLIGGRLSVNAGSGGVGACFRLELPR